MTISTSPTSMAPEEMISPATANTTETEEGATSAETNISLPSNQQHALLRSSFDMCYPIMKFIGNNLSLKPSSPPPALKHTLQGKSEKPASSMQQSLTTSPSLTSRSLSSPRMSTYPSASSDSSPSTPLPLEQSTFSWCPSSLAQQTCNKRLSFSLPQLPSSKPSGPSTLTFKRLSVPIFSKSTIRSLCSNNKLSYTPSKSETHTPSPHYDTPVSPLSLFSHIQQQSSHHSLQKRQEKEGGQQQQQQQQQQHHEHKQQHQVEEIQTTSTSTESTSATLPDEIIEFALSESQLSQLFNMRVSHYDVLRICAEIMKLMLQSRSLDQHEKRRTRCLFLEESEKLEKSYARQANISRWIGISTAVLGIMGAASPLCGEIAGDQILNFVQKHMGIWQKATSNTLFKNMGKVFTSLSQLSETSSKIYELQESSHRTISESHKEIMRMEHDEVVRMIEESKDHWKNMDSLLLQILQTQHDTVRSLLN